ncbi:MAG: SagB/ThcOx family dehydrogenase [Bacteroidales bacterium]|jgi:SagB-type dehydrogenase family enzyme|nr:SagB/ThcOx family dehydrogenase [Bacteroidales bacterium]
MEKIFYSFCILLLAFTTDMKDLSGQTTRLPDPAYHGEVSVEQAMLHRRSVREFEPKALTLQQVSQILWAAYGITREMSSPSFLRGGFKTAPSAGALYPLEIYLVAGKVKGLEPGIYKYLPEGHQLIKTYGQDVREDLAEAAINQEFIAQAPVSLFYAAVYSRTTGKYGQRGAERYVCMDLGHSAQNVCLQVVAQNLGTCPVGAFDDKMVRNVMMIPNEEEPLYIMPIGYPTGGGMLQER